ncbi:hypothetical protein D3C81_2019080 [compost metagenome]
MIDSRDSLAPWRKNSRAMALLVNQPKPTATWPLAGSRLASRTTPTRVRVKLSGKKRGRVMRVIQAAGSVVTTLARA